MVTKGYDNNNVLIIGAGSMGEELSEQIKQRTFLGRNIRGFLDDYVPPGVFVNGYEVLGTVVDLKGCIRRYFIDEVFITIPSEREKTKVIIQQCKEMNVSVKIVPEQFDSQEDILFSGHIGYLCVLEHLQQRVKKPESVRKRLIDVFLSLVGLILCAPLFLVIALAIKLSSSGPVIHISKRCGRKGNPFIFYKFRTMVIDAEKMRDELSDKNEAGGCLFKIKEDPRVTNVGKFLRRYSLDELPQLLNVLRGEMSIVGPRPLPFKDINPDDLAQLKRLEIRPGITGLWQVHGRSDASFKRLLRWDMWYVKNWSLGLDMVILLKTVRAVLSGRGAY
jgi:exopolysaccharide biosynthesis polyprenyl glycosylphosphotransferase